MNINSNINIHGPIVKKSNSLVRTKISISNIDASRILASLISCIQVQDEKLKTSYSISANNFLNLSGGYSYSRIKNICRILIQATAEIEDHNDINNECNSFIMMPFFSKISYRKGIITAKFNEAIENELINLKKCFTKYNLLEYLKLHSIYSQRMFEILKSWNSLPEVIITLTDLNKMLSTPESFKTDFAAFRRRVLEKSHDDIQKYTSLSYEWEPVKAGRVVESIRFIFNGEKKAIAQKDQEEAKERRRLKLRNKRFQKAIMCAKAKGGDCNIMDNTPIICKLCREQSVCESL